ncbi:MAG: endonuclease/exonuclease/phosphatase family protein, partial [Aggregatilineales bacterium]
RRTEIDLLLDATEAEPYPVIIMGDINMSAASADYRYLSEHYTDSFADSGWGLGTTFPNFTIFIPELPVLWAAPSVMRLDYIFIDEQFYSTDSEVIYQGVSDHFPVKTALRWAGN